MPRNTKENLLRDILGVYRHHQIDTVLRPNEKKDIYNKFATGVLNRALIENIKKEGRRRINNKYGPNNPYAGKYSYTNSRQ